MNTRPVNLWSQLRTVTAIHKCVNEGIAPFILKQFSDKLGLHQILTVSETPNKLTCLVIDVLCLNEHPYKGKRCDITLVMHGCISKASVINSVMPKRIIYATLNLTPHNSDLSFLIC